MKLPSRPVLGLAVTLLAAGSLSVHSVEDSRASSACTTTVTTDPAGWTGSGPWPIANEDELIYLSVKSNDNTLTAAERAEYLNANYVLTGSESTWSLGGCLWSPIGYADGGDSSATPANNEFYTGVFDGGGKTITGLNVVKSTQFAGLFGVINHADAVVRDLTLTGSVQSTASDVGGLVGSINAGTISGVTVNVSVTTTGGGAASVGGLAGDVNSATIEDSTSTGTVDNQTNGSFTGGLVGKTFGSITGSSATGDVSGVYAVGGLAGYSDGDIDQSSASGDVTGDTSENGDATGGLVGETYGGTISNSTASGAVSGGGSVGGLVGYAEDRDISNSSASGTVAGTGSDVGGLVGYIDTGDITDSYASGAVQSTGRRVGGLLGHGIGFVTVQDSYATGRVSGSDYVGGLVGELLKGTQVPSIIQSYATGDVEGVISDDNSSAISVGGLVGEMGAGTISQSFAAGQVTGTNRVGGLVGRFTTGSDVGSVSNSYASGHVFGSDRVGGLIGQVDYDPEESFKAMGVTNSYSTGVVEGSSETGGLIGGTAPPILTVTQSFWDTETSTLSTSPAGGTAKTTAQMTTLATYSDASWKIVAATEFQDLEIDGPPNEIWAIGGGVNCGYPFLWWQTVTGHSCPGATSAIEGVSERRAAVSGIHLDLQVQVGEQLAGSAVVIGGQGLAGRSGYTLIVRSTPQVLDSGRASALGNFSNSLEMPTLPAGSHTLTLTATGNDGSTLSLVQPFTVSASGIVTALPGTTGGTSLALAATGVPVSLVSGNAAAVGLLLVSGMALIALSGWNRRRAVLSKDSVED